MSVICQNFVQNTWRKDLCSNCFKSVSDHSESGHRNNAHSSQRYIPQATSLYQSRVLSPNFNWRTFLIDPAPPKYSDPLCSNKSYNSRISEDFSSTPDKMEMGKSILKTPSSKKFRTTKVGFASEEPLVIGYGGNDYDSDDSPWEMASDDGSINIELLDITDEDRSITKMTKDNTEFNSLNENLTSSLVSKEKSNNLPNKCPEENYSNNCNFEIDSNRLCSSKNPDAQLEGSDNSKEQPEKKLEYYFYSTKEETQPALRKFAEKLSNSSKVNTYIFNNLNNCSSVAEFDSKFEKLNKKNIRNANLLYTDDLKNAKTEEYSTYTTVDEALPKVNNCDPSSDSDYSTSRQTTGESSTDSESFHEGDEPVILPCSSFLHGSADKYRAPNILCKLSTDGKAYDGNSSSSCNLSTISSDESDSQMRADMRPEQSLDSQENGNEILECSNSDLPMEYTAKKNNQLAFQVPCISDISNLSHQNECNVQSQNTEEFCDSKQEAVTECKNWLPANDEWQSYQFVCNPSPSSSRSSEALSLQNIEDETKQSPVTNSNSYRTHPDSRKNRQTKLAALALELEQARCDPSPNESSKHQMFTPEAKQKTNFNDSSITETPPSLIGKIFKSGSCSSIENTTKHVLVDSINSSKLPHQSSRLSSMPDLLPDTPQKLKKGRFSLKKLLKRNKDLEPVVPSHGEHNLKAWKRHHFDRSRLSLEIVHPMDLTSDTPTSTESTPTEENNRSSIFTDPSGRGNRSTQRARSLSALPHLMSTPMVSNDSAKYSPRDDTMSASLDRSKKELSSTVAERGKKNKAPTRTPSCSALHSSSLSSSGNSTKRGVGSQRPPKPPPPPRGKSLPQVTQPQSQGPCKNSVPARPPPPKLSDGKENYFSPLSKDSGTPCSSNGQYANLGDIRSHLAPKKPQRLSLVQCKKEHKDQHLNDSTYDRDADNTYETLEVTEEEEEDHYTYLDESEAKSYTSKEASSPNGQISPSSGIRDGNANLGVQEAGEEKPGSQSTPDGPGTANSDEKPPRRPPDPIPCALKAVPERKRPWFDLQASYAAIAAANYESLSELISAAFGEEIEPFQKSSSLQWGNFDLESKKPIQMLEDKVVYNAVYNSHPKIKVTLLVTTQKQHTSQNCRNPTRPPVLASFNDYIPRYCLSMTEDHCPHSDVTKAMIYVLQRSKTTTVSQFAHDSASQHTNQHLRLRNACFVLLQLIYTLKNLQVDGIEEIDYDLSRIFLITIDSEKPPILVLLPGDKIYLSMIDFFKSDSSTRRITLCQATQRLMFHLLQITHPEDLHNCMVNGELLADPIVHTFAAVAKVLSEEKASSLSQAKGLLEYMLWGPVDVISGTNSTDENVDAILQRWLDLQRAQMVKSLVSSIHIKINTCTGLHIYDEYQMLFLLQATAKGLKDIILKL